MNVLLASATASALTVVITGNAFGIDDPVRFGDSSFGAAIEIAQTGSRFAGVPPPGSKRPDGARYDGSTNRSRFSGVAPPGRELRDEDEATASASGAVKTADLRSRIIGT